MKERQDYHQRNVCELIFRIWTGRFETAGFGLMLVAVTIMRLLHNRPELPSVPAPSRSARRITRMWQAQPIDVALGIPWAL